MSLHRILPKFREVTEPSVQVGLDMAVGQVCDEVASAIVGKQVQTILPQLDKALALDPQVTSHEYKVARYFFDKASHGEATALGNVNAGVAPSTFDGIARGYMQVIVQAPYAARIIAKELGVNEYADPRVGQAFGSITLGEQTAAGFRDLRADPTGHTFRTTLSTDATRSSGIKRDIWGTHYGAVVAESAGNKITLENYGRKGEDPVNTDYDPIYYFQMYGPAGGPQSWHTQWATGANPVLNPITMVYG